FPWTWSHRIRLALSAATGVCPQSAVNSLAMKSMSRSSSAAGPLQQTPARHLRQPRQLLKIHPKHQWNNADTDPFSIENGFFIVVLEHLDGKELLSIAAGQAPLRCPQCTACWIRLWISLPIPSHRGLIYLQASLTHEKENCHDS